MTSPHAVATGSGGPVRSAIAGIGTFLPDHVVTAEDVEARLRDEGVPEDFLPPPGAILECVGVAERRYKDPGDDASDLAVRAARAALADAGLEAGDVPLLIFASGSQDLIEPATAHLVNLKLGGAHTAFDVKNACNSFLNGLQVADALIRAGQYERALVCTGESPSMTARWDVRTRKDLMESLGGYTLGDAGAAVVLERRTDGTGIDHVAFRSRSDHWDLCTVRGGGTMHEFESEHRYFRSDGNRMRAAFEEWGRRGIEELLRPTLASLDDFDLCLVHQVTGVFFEDFLRATGVSRDRTVPIVQSLGNIASASLPVQLHRARAAGRLVPGSRVLLVGLGAGISLGVMTLRM